MNIRIDDPQPDDHATTGVFGILKPGESRTASMLENLIERYTSRKFAMCALLQVATTVAAYRHLIDGGTWLAFSTLVLGTYCGASIADKHYNGGVG